MFSGLGYDRPNSPGLRHRLIDMIQALIQKDSETLLRLVPHLTADFPPNLNYPRLERDLWT